MKYSDSPPNKEGWYWMRSKSGFESIKRVFISHHEELSAYTTNVQGDSIVINVEKFKGYAWAGPIHSPDN